MEWRLMVQDSVKFACIEPEHAIGVLLGVPMDYTSTYKPGSRFAPDAIRSAACNIEFYSLSTGRVLEDTGFKDLGNMVLPPGDTEASLRVVKSIVEGVRGEYPDLLLGFLGGEHLVTYPIVEALMNSLDTLVVFDAHLDLRDEYLGSRVNHATFLRRLVEKGVKVVHIGSRAYSREELDYASKSSNLEIHPVTQLPSKLRELGRVYISIDMDVIDPSYAPGVGNPEPFGLTPLTLLKLLEEVARASEKIVGFDVVEVNPLVDINDVTSILAGKLVLEIAALSSKLG